MHLCWAHGLYDAIISIHNRGMKDFLGPLCELLVLLISALDSGVPLSGKWICDLLNTTMKRQQNVHRIKQFYLRQIFLLFLF